MHNLLKSNPTPRLPEISDLLDFALEACVSFEYHSDGGLGSSIPMHPRHAGGVTVTQSSGSEISVSCETVATQGSTLQTSSWSIVTWCATCGFF